MCKIPLIYVLSSVTCLVTLGCHCVVVVCVFAKLAVEARPVLKSGAVIRSFRRSGVLCPGLSSRQ